MENRLLCFNLFLPGGSKQIPVQTGVDLDETTRSHQALLFAILLLILNWHPICISGRPNSKMEESTSEIH